MSVTPIATRSTAGLTRVSMGAYALFVAASRVILRRNGRKGFRVEMGRSSLHATFRTLREAVAAARMAASPSLWRTDAVPEAPQAIEFAHEDVARHGKSKKMASAAPDAAAAPRYWETRLHRTS
jgi:hypothetical protein